MAMNNETIGIANLKTLEGGPLQVGGRKQLFIDDRFIEVFENISLVMNPPVKVNEPVFGSEKPWEAFRLAFFNVLRDESLFKMWYSAFDNDQWKGLERMLMCYATSEDGIHWERPELRLVEYEGSKANNIVAAPWRRLIQFVFIDEHGTSEQRYKMILCRISGTEDEKGIYVITSPDGIHWTKPGERLRPMTWDTQKMGYWDEGLGKYVVFERVMGKRGRAIGRLEMEDITAPWSMPTPLVLESDEQDPPDSDLYTSVIYKYPYAEDAYFAFPMTYQHFAPDQSPVENDGTCDVQMAVSRDGRNWSRPDRRPYVERGLPGEIDCGMTCLTSTVRVLNSPPLSPRTQGDVWHYGIPWPYTHGGFRRLSDEERAKSWGRAFLMRYIQRLDGFMSADAAYTGGYLITPPLIFEGNRLEINVNSSAMGFVRVGILDENGRVIPGFSADKCEKISFNSLAYVVKWRNESDVSELAGKPIRLKFVMRGAKLYAFQFTF